MNNDFIAEIEKEKITIEAVIKVFRSNFPTISTHRIQEAYQFAYDAHNMQTRKSGEAYITHPVYTAYLIASIKLDEASIIAALLHDTVEDTQVSLEDIEVRFGEETAELVKGLTIVKNVTKNIDNGTEDFESLRKLLIASTKDVRLILIKLADRLHNMLTIDGLPASRRISYSNETLKFYAPLADFVGINFFRKKLEDLAFRTLEPKTYRNITHYLETNQLSYEEKKIPREEYIHKSITLFTSFLKDAKLKGDVYGRHKGTYSIYRKIYSRHKTFSISMIEEINDLVGITILTNSIADCYKILGNIHAHFEYNPSLFDDYIAKPKSNGYRSIHTNIKSKDGVKIALQIKTHKMHEYNEYGPASHIYYKEKAQTIPLGDRIPFLKSLVMWKDQVNSIEQYKVDVFKDKVFVFTPKGDVKELQKGSTIVDFAYCIHSNVGNSCRGGKVNGQLKPLNFEIHTGDVIEVLVDKKRQKPSQDWLSFVVTPYAKFKIKHALKEPELEDEIIEEEKEISQEDTYIAPDTFELDRKVVSERLANAPIVKIKGIDNIECSIAKCCSPIPGDDIIGHVTKTRGIRIHRKNCTELALLEYKILLEAEWLKGKKEFKAGIFLQASTKDTAHVMQDISKSLADMKITLEKMDSWTTDSFNCRLVVVINSKVQLEQLMKRLKKGKSIVQIQRVALP